MRNEVGERTVEFAVANNLAIINTYSNEIVKEGKLLNLVNSQVDLIICRRK